jgi:hypothetical protein
MCVAKCKKSLLRLLEVRSTGRSLVRLSIQIFERSPDIAYALDSAWRANRIPRAAGRPCRIHAASHSAIAICAVWGTVFNTPRRHIRVKSPRVVGLPEPSSSKLLCWCKSTFEVASWHQRRLMRVSVRCCLNSWLEGFWYHVQFIALNFCVLNRLFRRDLHICSFSICSRAAPRPVPAMSISQLLSKSVIIMTTYVLQYGLYSIPLTSVRL